MYSAMKKGWGIEEDDGHRSCNLYRPGRRRRPRDVVDCLPSCRTKRTDLGGPLDLLHQLERERELGRAIGSTAERRRARAVFLRRTPSVGGTP